MKWYIASRKKDEEKVKEMIRLLEEKKQEISFDWTQAGSVKPYSQNIEKCQEISQNIMKAIKDSDIFILLSDEQGTDMFIELGIALSCCEDSRKPKVYILGEHNKRSMMHLHPSVIHLNSFKELLEQEKII